VFRRSCLCPSPLAGKIGTVQSRGWTPSWWEVIRPDGRERAPAGWVVSAGQVPTGRPPVGQLGPCCSGGQGPGAAVRGRPASQVVPWPVGKGPFGVVGQRGTRCNDESQSMPAAPESTATTTPSRRRQIRFAAPMSFGGEGFFRPSELGGGGWCATVRARWGGLLPVRVGPRGLAVAAGAAGEFCGFRRPRHDQPVADRSWVTADHLRRLPGPSRPGAGGPPGGLRVGCRSPTESTDSPQPRWACGNAVADL